MPLPIPLHGFKGSNTQAGTGFLVRDGTKVWLVTCVHIITALKETPPSFELFSGARIEVVDTPTVLYLFEGNNQRISVVTNQSEGFLADVMAIRLTTTEVAALFSYGAYDLSTVVTPICGESVTATGFPGMGQTLIRPMTLAGHVADIVGMSVKLTVPSAPGYSGSALQGETGLIGIMHGDVGEPQNLVNGLAISFEVVGPHLFI